MGVQGAQWILARRGLSRRAHPARAREPNPQATRSNIRRRLMTEPSKEHDEGVASGWCFMPYTILG